MSLRPINRHFFTSGSTTALERVQQVSSLVNGVLVRDFKPTFVPADKQQSCNQYTITAQAQRGELQKVSTAVLRDSEAIKDFADEVNILSLTEKQESNYAAK